MRIEKNKMLWYLSITLAGLFFITQILKSLTIGGRWDLNQQIAFGYRISDGIVSYSNGVTDLFFPSSPYFPGVGFLSYCYKILGIEDVLINNQLMLFTAAIIGVLFFILMFKLTKKIYPSISSNIILILLTLLFVTSFRTYIMYMMEFKPDTIMLVIGLFALFLLENNKKPTFIRLFVIAILLFIVTFFKQSAFLIYFLIYILVIFNKYLSIRKKIIILFCYTLIGLLSLYILFRINNIYYFTIEIMSAHPLLDFSTINNFIIKTIRDNLIFLLGLAYFIFQKYKKIKINTLEFQYLLFCIAWLAFSILATIKLGGNTGNSEVGLIVFLPFSIYALDNILKYFYKYKAFSVVVLFVLFSLILLVFTLFIKETVNYKNRIENFNISSQYLAENFEGSKAFVDGDTFILAKKAKLDIITESETIGHFNNVPNFDMKKLKDALTMQYYDIIFVNNLPFYLEKGQIVKILNHNYQPIKDQFLPKYLTDKIYIRKEK